MNAFLRLSEANGSMVPVIILKESKVVKRLQAICMDFFMQHTLPFLNSSAFSDWHVQKHIAVSGNEAEQVMDQRNNREALLFLCMGCTFFKMLLI
ncbi:hypothetical protein [uncultured Oscillibacter sp.]|uniref:hypothetical protein n=1 Tax=uncultured Oscillibacter sp. TaxID=876091 RepID=UPI002616E913|nr:hypothetical protein [uncultured Oscillibacter sp.]